jgi:sigma54-dependent transcription regulator
LPVVLAAHPNVLIVGSEQIQDAAVRALTPFLRQPVTMLPSASELLLPSGGSVILRTIGDLTLRGQKELFSWLEGRGRNIQVVSLSPVQLFPLVIEGRFLEDLYYRINILQFDADENVNGGHLLTL